MISEESYYDHYKDSFKQQKCYIAKRDNYTIALFAMVVVLCLQACDTKIVNDSVNDFLRSRQCNINLDFKYIKISLSFVFLWLIMQYYQVCLTIEKTYNYIHDLEDNLTKKGIYKIEREGVSYLKSYPWLKVVTHRIYVLLFPLLFIFVAFIGAYTEIKNICICSFSWFSLFTSIAYILNIFVSLLYLSNRWFNEEAFSKKIYPNLNIIERLTLYLQR